MNLRASLARLAGGRLWPLPIVVVLAILSAATYGAHNSSVRYSAAMTGLSPGMAAPEDLHLWRRSLSGLTFSGEGAKSEVRLAARQVRGLAAVETTIEVPDGADGLRVELGIGAENFQPGAKHWQNARLQIFSFDRAGNFLRHWPKDVIVVLADRPFGPASDVLPLRQGLGRVLVRIFNGADSGTLRIGPPKIAPTTQRPAFTLLRGGLIAAWAATGLWAAWAAARRASTPLRAGVLLGIAALVLGGALVPKPIFRPMIAPIETGVLAVADYLFQQQSPHRSRAAGDGAGEDRAERGEEAVPRASSPVTLAPEHIIAPRHHYPIGIEDIGHFSMFLLLGVACFAAFPRPSHHGRMLCLASFAVATESLQCFVATRSSSVADLAADMAGLILAAAVAAVGSWIAAAAIARNRDRVLPGA